MSDKVIGALDETIAGAVTARIEAEVAAALASSDMIGQYVAAALTQKIKIEDPRDRYSKVETTFLKLTIDKAIQDATKTAVVKVIAAEAEEIERVVAAELRSNVKVIAKALVGNVQDAVEKPYGVNVELRYPGR